MKPRTLTSPSGKTTAASQAATPGGAYLRIENVWKAFGAFHALKGVSLDVEQGEFVCFLGPSGCGKTTLLRAIAGLDPQTRGAIHQGGVDISRLPPSKRDYGIVFQSYALFPNLTIARNIAFGLENTGHSRSQVKARVTELLDLVGLAEQTTKYPSQLSGGQQQRVALARAIAIKPGLLLLDEPLSALDAKVRVHLRHEIKELQRKLGVTTIMVTHDQEEALAVADRIVVMEQGLIDQVGTPTDVYRHPATLFAADFIGETNQISTGYARGGVTVGQAFFRCEAAGVREGDTVTMVIRPEDVVAHAVGREAKSSPNHLNVAVADMEFLGSCWRTHLTGDALGGTVLIANLSMTDVRRFELAVGRELTVELPAERLLLFAEGGNNPGNNNHG